MTADAQSGSTADSATDEPVYIESEDHLNSVVADGGVVLVDFYADWCGPCKMIEPVLETLADETSATVAKVDVDSLQGLAGKYGVRGVPTLYLFADGEHVEQHTGALPAEQLRGLVESYT